MRDMISCEEVFEASARERAEFDVVCDEWMNEAILAQDAEPDASYRGLADGGALVTCCGCGEEVRINSEEADEWTDTNLFRCWECE